MTGPLFPENYSKVWIRGRFITMAGVAVRGKLTLAPTVTGGGLVNRSLKLIMSTAAFSADTDNDGYVALQVPATNDPDITPVNFTYSVTTPIGQKFSIVVPYDTTPLNSVGDPLHGQPVIELIDMVPVGSSGGVGQLLRGIGVQSMVDDGAGGLLITYTDLSTTTITMPDTVAGPPGPVGPAGPVGPTGPTGPAGGGATKLTDLTDVTTAGAVAGDLLAFSGVGPPAVGKKSPADLPISAATQNAFDRSLIHNARVQVDPEAYDYFDREVVTCTVPTYDGSNVLVHPSVLYFAEGWNGYRYWMSFTPYPGQQSVYENPSIVVSDDGITWVVPPGLTNPIVPNPGGGVYNNDPHLTWGPDNRLYMIYRTTFPSNTDSYYYMSSTDGVTWTAPVKMFDLDRTVESLLSPCIWYDRAASEWVMLGIDMVPNPRVMRRRTATSLTAWAASTAVTMSPAAWESGKDMWHMDAKPVGNQVIALISDNTAGGTAGQGGLYFAVSSDRGKTFRRSTLKLGADAGLNKYRSSFWPMLREDGLGFDVWVGTISSVTRVATRRRRDVLGEHAKGLGAATGGTYPFLAGDSFNRADSTTGVGNADSGQAWTTLNGAPGVIGKQAYASTAVNTRAVIDVGAADVEVSALITMTTSGQAWLMARAADSANYIRFGRQNSSSFKWEQIVAGAAAATGANLILDPALPNLFTIRCKGARVQFLLNGVLIEEASLATGATNTKVGFQADNIAARFDALTVRVPV